MGFSDTWYFSHHHHQSILNSGHLDTMKKLSDLCLGCIGENLNCINRVRVYLTTFHKEQLLERLGFHDKLTVQYLPHITYNLFAPALKRVNWYKCEQVTNALLKQLGASGCQLRHLTIHACPNVSGTRSSLIFIFN